MAIINRFLTRTYESPVRTENPCVGGSACGNAVYEAIWEIPDRGVNPGKENVGETQHSPENCAVSTKKTALTGNSVIE